MIFLETERKVRKDGRETRKWGRVGREGEREGDIF